MSDVNPIDDTYEAFSESFNVAKIFLNDGEDPAEVMMAIHQIAINAFYMLCGQVFKHIKNGDDAWAIHATVSRALALSMGSDVYAKLRRDRLMAMFPSLLVEGDKA